MSFVIFELIYEGWEDFLYELVCFMFMAAVFWFLLWSNNNLQTLTKQHTRVGEGERLVNCGNQRRTRKKLLVVHKSCYNDHSTAGSFSTHDPLWRSNFFFKLFMIILLEASAFPLDVGCLGVEKINLIPHFSQKSWNLKDIKWDPLSMNISFRMPKRHMMFFQTNFITSVSLILLKASASIYFVK